MTTPYTDKLHRFLDGWNVLRAEEDEDDCFGLADADEAVGLRDQLASVEAYAERMARERDFLLDRFNMTHEDLARALVAQED